MSERLTRTTRALLLSLAATMSAPAADWEALPPLPEPNGGALCGSVGGKIVLVGGTHWEGGTKNWLRAIHEFDPMRKIWRKVKDLEAGPVAYGIPMQEASRFSFVGGSDGTRAWKAFAFVDGLTTELQPVPDLPSSVVLSGGGVVGGKYLVVGGTEDTANVASVQRSTHSVEWSDGRWTVTKLADYPGRAFAVAASAVVGEELYLFGGMNYDTASSGVVNSTSCYAFSPTKNSWRQTKSLAVANRGLAGIALDEQHIYLAGGYTGTFTTEAFIYDVKTDVYRSAEPLPYPAMVSLVRSGGYVYCLGGEDKMKSRTDKFFRVPIAELLK